MSDEFEVVQHPQINNLNLFFVTIDYRTPHIHRDFEINLVLEGEAEIVCENRTHTVLPGNMILINPNQPHEIKTTGSSVSLLCLQLSPKLFNGIYQPFENTFFDNILPFEHTEQQKQLEIQDMFIEMAICYTKKIQHHQILCMGFLNLLIFFLLEQLPSHQITFEERAATMKKVERLNRIIQYVDENYMHKVRLLDLAEQEGLSLSYLSHFIKDNFNQTFQEYVSTVRFNQARKLLLSGNKRILDVCIESGFSDPRYLTKAFMENTGMLPDEYRKQHEKSSSPAKHRSIHSSQQYYSPEETVLLLETYRRYFLKNVPPQK